MNLALLFAVILASPQDAKEAEAVFKKMEETFVAAKTFQTKLTGDMAEQKFKLTGSFMLDEGGRARVELDGKSESENRKGLVTSDGKKIRFESSDRKEPRLFDAPATFGKLLRISFARAGALSALEFAESEDRAKTEPETGYVTSAHKLEPAEKVGDRDAKVVSYTVTRRKRDAAAVVWIDAATNLPLKRTLKMGGVALTEVYTDTKVDEKIDPATFELPKETK